jgi:hypothetical protein
VRIANSAVFRKAMRAAPEARRGLIVDDYLRECVRQGFRADINPFDYAPVRVPYPGMGLEATAWLRLFEYSGQPVSSLLG